MKKLLLKTAFLKLFLFLSIMSLGQARIVINGATPVTIVEKGGTQAIPVYIEIANSNSNAITTIGSNGWIISESEFNMVKFDIGTTVGTYTIPFGYNYPLPLIVNINIAGSLGGDIKFSTYHTVPDNKLQMPSDVTNMGSMNNSNLDNSYNVVDRFYILDAYSYGTKPTLSSIEFSYISSAGNPSEVAAPNVFLEPNLIAQRFNTSIHSWGDWLGAGPVVPGGNVGTVTNNSGVSPSNFFRSWTLSNSIDPLPIQLSSFTDQCNNGYAFIQWTSQTELNNASYTIRKTSDNIHFEIVKTIKGAGNSSFPINYSIVDSLPLAGTSYYVLSQTDIDGNTKQLETISFENCSVINNTTINAWNTNNNYIELKINSSSNDNFTISLYNVFGQEILQEQKSVNIGDNEVQLNDNNLSQGIYIINIRNDKYNWSQKLSITR